MNQITMMFMESNRRMKKLMKGLESGETKPDLEIIAAAQREFEADIKLINGVVTAFGISSKNNRVMRGLERMNVMEDTTAIDLMLGDPEVDKVKCPVDDKLIMRSECLDYSGEHSLDDCKGCEIGLATKDLLIPIQDRK